MIATVGGAGRPDIHFNGLAVAALSCAVAGLGGWYFFLHVLTGDPLQDWMVFYTAAQAYLGHNLPLIFDPDALTAAINQRFAGWLGPELPLHPWVYPPTFLFLFLPFGALPAAVSAVCFLSIGWTAAIAAIWRFGESPKQRWLLVGTLLLCPAVPFNVLTGQNAFYCAAVLVGAFGIIERRPFLAGALLGLLSVKPQFCLMAGVALLAARQWEALASAAVTAIVLALISLLVIGMDAWRGWLDLVTGVNGFYAVWVPAGRLNGTSVFACARWLGAPAGIAESLQAVAMVFCAGAVFWLHRRPAPANARLAALCAATVLAAPHASNSDAVLLGIAAALFVTFAVANEVRPLQLALCAAVWVMPLYNPPALFRFGCVTPVLVTGLLCMIVLAVRHRQAQQPTSIAAAIGDPADAAERETRHGENAGDNAREGPR
jgi:glycosyl transferase family 87